MSINGIPGIDQQLLSHVVYVDRPCHNTIWKQGSLEPNYDFIQQLLIQDRLPVINFSSEHWGHRYTIDSTYQLLSKYFTKFVVMTHHLDDHLQQPNLVFYPYWNFATKEKFNFVNNINGESRTYKASCLNKLPRFHRIMNFFYLSQKSYAQNCFFRISRTTNPFAFRADDYEIPKEILTWWNKYSQSLDISIAQPPWYHGHNIDGTLIAFTDAYLNIVTETTVIPRIFVTEKTWKAIATGQFFIIVGNPGTIQHLRKLGIDTYDDIINHDYYDQEQDWILRLEKIHQIIDATVSLDLEKIWKQTVDRRKLNQEKFQNGNFGLKYKEILLQKIL